METDISDLPVTVQLRAGYTKMRTVYQLMGFGSALVWGVHNNSLNNLLRGLKERVFCVSRGGRLEPTPQPVAGVFERKLQQVRTQLLRWLPLTARVDYDTFVGYYQGRKRSIYQRAVESLLSVPLAKADAEVKTFVKAEKVNFTKKPDPAPRLIQPRSPRYNVEVGRWLRPMEKLVYRAIRKVWGGPTVLKGMNAAETGKALHDMWTEFTDPVAVGLDASRFDQHVSAEAIRWEHSVYIGATIPRERAELGRILRMQLNNKGVAYTGEGKVSYRVAGCRMSGDINTSLGNCLIMCSLVLQYAIERQVHCRLANNGDDCVVFLERADLERFMAGLTEWFLEFGFEMEVEDPVFTFEHVVFCQSQPIWTPSGWLMVRNPHVSTSKDCVSLLDLREGFRGYSWAVGTCGLAATGGIPVVQELYKALAAVGKPVSTMDIGRGLQIAGERMARPYQEPHPYTRVSYCLAFGTLPDEQEAMEEALRRNPVPLHPKITLTPLSNFYIQ